MQVGPLYSHIIHPWIWLNADPSLSQIWLDLSPLEVTGVVLRGSWEGFKSTETMHIHGLYRFQDDLSAGKTPLVVSLKNLVTFLCLKRHPETQEAILKFTEATGRHMQLLWSSESLVIAFEGFKGPKSWISFCLVFSVQKKLRPPHMYLHPWIYTYIPSFLQGVQSNILTSQQTFSKILQLSGTISSVLF